MLTPCIVAAPMLCAGITAWSPLSRHKAGPGMCVGVLGIGGIGHFALLWAKALHCDKIVVINRSSSKKADCMSLLGADAFIAMEEDKDWAGEHVASLDLLISTSDSGNMPMGDILRLLKLGGTFVTVGVAAEPLQHLNTFALCSGMVKIEGSFWGTFSEIDEMLEFATVNKVKPLVHEFPITEANDVIQNQVRGNARYKYVVKMV